MFKGVTGVLLAGLVLAVTLPCIGQSCEGRAVSVPSPPSCCSPRASVVRTWRSNRRARANGFFRMAVVNRRCPSGCTGGGQLVADRRDACDCRTAAHSPRPRRMPTSPNQKTEVRNTCSHVYNDCCTINDCNNPIIYNMCSCRKQYCYCKQDCNRFQGEKKQDCLDACLLDETNCLNVGGGSGGAPNQLR